jgi:hypothetical protein
MALAFAEDVERNLVGELPVSAIVQMIAGNLVEVKDLGMGKVAPLARFSLISRVHSGVSRAYAFWYWHRHHGPWLRFEISALIALTRLSKSLAIFFAIRLLGRGS